MPLRYAAKRLMALGRRVDLDLTVDSHVDVILEQVNVLADVCDALADRQPDKALTLLDDARTPSTPSAWPNPCGCAR
ncbi:hypothetical protein QEZ54_07185 [Catellatospora sp. KI3]|uniref:hypothetical protein n=1 Tax=Catellatospora sp. KI3 TaxID=3041620 RepID=UPI002482CA15|nr:hypothetical protein [Catellatospora sp. KI3]MDI1460744.1 hypothetical protein [Catellatospora sp. KI3]